jgi:hypothetical protein
MSDRRRARRAKQVRRDERRAKKRNEESRPSFSSTIRSHNSDADATGATLERGWTSYPMAVVDDWVQYSDGEAKRKS